MINWDNFPGSTVPMKSLMWRAKCPIKAWRCPFAHFVSSLYNCAPSGAKQRFTGTFTRFRHRYKGPNEGLNASLGHKVPLCQRCAFSITVPRNGQKNTFRDKNIEEICPFPHRRRGVFYFKNDTFYLEKGALLGCGNFGSASAPRPPDSIALDCALSGQCERFTGTISRFRRPYKSPNVSG